MNHLMPMTWRPVQLPLIPRRSSLGQAAPQTNNLMVEVVDQAGKPVRGATVDFFVGGQQQGSAQTDSKGAAGFSAMGSGPFEVRATYQSMSVGDTVSSADIAKGYTKFLQFPLCVNDPLFRGVDLLIFGVAGGMIAAGSYWKVKPLEMTGEIALGAAVFGFIYRLQCM